MRRLKLIPLALGLSVAIVGVAAALPPETRTEPAAAQQTAAFDHSNCQYPDRWSNPVDGCDNSDPAVPECIKAAYSQESEQACIDDFVEANRVNDSNNATQPALNTPITPVTSVTECGGK